jgi:hypothetical protein
MSPINLRDDPTNFETLMETIEARMTVLYEMLGIDENRSHQYMFNVKVEDLLEDERFVLMDAIPALASAILPEAAGIPGELMHKIVSEIDEKAEDAECIKLSPVGDEPPSNEYLVDLTAGLRAYILLLEGTENSMEDIKQKMIQKMRYVIADLFLQINYPIPDSLLGLVAPEDIELLKVVIKLHDQGEITQSIDKMHLPENILMNTQEQINDIVRLFALAAIKEREKLNSKTAKQNEQMNKRLIRFLGKYPDPSVLVDRLFEEHGESTENYI